MPDVADTQAGKANAGPVIGTPGVPTPGAAPGVAAPAPKPAAQASPGQGGGASNDDSTYRQRYGDLQRGYQELKEKAKAKEADSELLAKVRAKYDVDTLLSDNGPATPGPAPTNEAPGVNVLPDPLQAIVREVWKQTFEQTGDPILAGQKAEEQVEVIRRKYKISVPMPFSSTAPAQAPVLTEQQMADVVRREVHLAEDSRQELDEAIDALRANEGQSFLANTIEIPPPQSSLSAAACEALAGIQGQTMRRDTAMRILSRATGERDPERLLFILDPAGHDTVQGNRIRARMIADARTAGGAAPLGSGAGPLAALVAAPLTPEAQQRRERMNRHAQATGASLEPPKR